MCLASEFLLLMLVLPVERSCRLVALRVETSSEQKYIYIFCSYGDYVAVYNIMAVFCVFVVHHLWLQWPAVKSKCTLDCCVSQVCSTYRRSSLARYGYCVC